MGRLRLGVVGVGVEVQCGCGSFTGKEPGLDLAETGYGF